MGHLYHGYVSHNQRVSWLVFGAVKFTGILVADLSDPSPLCVFNQYTKNYLFPHVRYAPQVLHYISDIWFLQGFFRVHLGCF